ncbi:MAG TPA: Na+/H+ antiporter, partial [Gemmatimonadales bacterium]|nr:Na+/H+ antiporter [Gemmatimonadales bacterium]
METPRQAEIVILLMMVMVGLTAIARKLLVPYPILLVLGGLALGLLTDMPEVVLEPDLVFLIFLPPILWSAAYGTSLRDFKANAGPIALLALGLVLATTVAVAWMTRMLLPGIGWPAALALGAIVSPPDAVAVTAIGRRLRVPRRVVVILEGESLVNDASALILYRAAVAAAVTGAFSLGDTLLGFVLAATAGVAIGVAVAAAAIWAMRRTHDSLSEIGMSLVAPYVAWIIAERAEVSAVLACVAGGIHLRRHFSEVAAAATRVQARAIWEQLVFLLNGAIFVLIGLEVGVLRTTVLSGRIGTLLWYGLVITLVAVAVRLAWVPLATLLPRVLSAAGRRAEPAPGWGPVFLIAWTGLRGIVSLAAALALPLRTADGEPFPFRAEIVVITFVVILLTLVVQGLSLAPLIGVLRLPGEDLLEREERRAREHAVTAA